MRMAETTGPGSARRGDDAAVAAEVRAVREEYAEEEAEAAEVEAASNAAGSGGRQSQLIMRSWSVRRASWA